MAQFGRPVSDVQKTNWNGVGDTTNLYNNADEVTANDSTDYNYSTNNVGSPVIEHALTALSSPSARTGHILRVKVCKTNNGTPATDGNTASLVFSLYQGGTLIQSSASTGALTATWTAFSVTISEANANNITDYSDLRLVVTGTVATGGATGVRRGVAVTWGELEIPDAPSSTVLESSATATGSATAAGGTNMVLASLATASGSSTATGATNFLYTSTCTAAGLSTADAQAGMVVYTTSTAAGTSSASATSSGMAGPYILYVRGVGSRLVVRGMGSKLKIQ